MMRAPVLITGSNGRLGRALQRVGAGSMELVGVAGARAASARGKLDVTDASAVASVIDEIRPRAIIHLASIVGAACEADPATAEAVNVGGTANLLAAALRFDVERIVFASTAAIYGDSRRRPVAEHDAPMPNGIYAETKLRAEQVLADVSDSLASDSLRVFNVYGPEMPDSLVERLQNATVDAPVKLNGLDGFVRDYVHVDDVARALLASADSTAAGFRVLNVGSGIPRSNRDLLDSFPDEVRAAVSVGDEIESYSCADIEAIGKELSWRPLMPWPPIPPSPRVPLVPPAV